MRREKGSAPTGVGSERAEQPDDSDSHSKIAAQESPHDTSSDVQWGVGGFSAPHGPPTSTRLLQSEVKRKKASGKLAVRTCFRHVD
ncbi:MAG TPA: hypothetical protein VGJ00_01790 [Rhabdochlamydiaceae bacterium]